MKRLTLIPAVAAVALVSVGVVSATRSGRSAARPYVVKEIKSLAAVNSLTIAAINSYGDIAATVGGSGHAVVAVLRAGTSHEQFIRLGVPPGFRDASANGINPGDSIAVNAARADRTSAGFVAEFRNGTYHWVRLHAATAASASYQVAGIAAGGDVAGTILTPAGAAKRAVIWRAQANGAYTPAAALPLTKGSTRSSASSIWSGGTVELVGGAEGRGNRASGRFTVWSPNPAQSGPLPGMLRQMWLPSLPVTIGGWGHHVYASGRVMGIDSGGGWRSAIQLMPGGAVRTGSFHEMPAPKHTGIECFYGSSSVSAAADGKFVSVGGISCLGVAPGWHEALIWRGNRVIALQTRVSNASGWTLSDASAINIRGQIVGTGYVRGHAAAYLLSRTRAK
jgi:hypothetical protein